MLTPPKWPIAGCGAAKKIKKSFVCTNMWLTLQKNCHKIKTYLTKSLKKCNSNLETTTGKSC